MNSVVILNYNDDELTAPKLAKLIASSSIDQDYSNLIISVTSDWKLRELPVVVNRSRESWDIYLAFNNSVGNQELITEELVIESLDIDHLFLSTNGLNELAKANSMTSILNFPKDLRVRVIESVEKINMPQESLSLLLHGLLQMFYWMLGNQAPIILFGIPGVVLSYSDSGYQVMLLIPSMS